MLRKMLSSLLLIVSFFIVLSGMGFYSAIRPFKLTSHISPADFGLAYDTISFTTQDNITLHGWFIPSEKPTAKTMILLHGYPADKGDILPAMHFLHHHYNLLLFDFRYLGQSGGTYSTAGKKEVLDLLAAIQYLRSRHINEVGIWGFSMGGSVALMAARHAPEIKAIAAEAPYARLDWLAYRHYRIPILAEVAGEMMRWWAYLILQFDIKDVAPAEYVKQLQLPILLIYSENDDLIDQRHALLMKQALKHNKKAEVILAPAGAHGQLIPGHQQLILRFFEKYFN